MKAYKGFNWGWTCRVRFPYRVGESYRHRGRPKICDSGFHGCTDRMDVLRFYSPGASRVGENGIEPNVWYELDEDGNFR